MQRRHLLLLSLLAAGAGLPARAQDRVRLGAAWRGPALDSTHHVGVLQVDWAQRSLAIAARVAVPSRPHGLLAEPGGSLVAVALRPGRWLLRLDADGRLMRQIDIDDEAPPRRFDGHVIASADGRLLYTTETDSASGAGRIGVRDAATLKKLDDWASHGLEPHQLLRDPEGHLMVANGGIRRGAADRKIDLDHMDASLVRLDGAGGTPLGLWRLPDARLSLRHLAWADDGLLGVALQAEHDDPAQRQAAPALALWDGRRLTAVPGGDGYAGDIAAAPGDGFVVSHAMRDVAWWWQPAAPQQLTAVAQLQRAYALAGGGGVLIAAARGLARWHPQAPAAMLPWPEPMALDNHMVRLG